jgi:hypothetical protein
MTIVKNYLSLPIPAKRHNMPHCQPLIGNGHAKTTNS